MEYLINYKAPNIQGSITSTGPNEYILQLAAKPRKKKYQTMFSMSSSSSTRFRLQETFLSLFPLVLIFGVVYLLGVSSSILEWCIAFVPILYAIHVVNEFPHDPIAFTQVSIYYAGYMVHYIEVNWPFMGRLRFFRRWMILYFGEGLTLLEQSLFQVTLVDKKPASFMTEMI
ncbi:hypothetical protein NC653_038722 [Populus alba x Populus x berolinensis]|uniref:Uncharacterized protein n=1 Tax=Populus alba x Populus x berolinensis TaxID=444605 RepID=A0AAD6LHL5_9ROSI|nr:hypothetical protein NC653_038722 [Populus alba x Populus x berolinensis]